MARETPRLTRPREGAGFEGTLAPARTVLVVAPTRTKAGELAGALQDKGIPSPFATSGRQAVYWMRQEPPALIAVDMRTSGSRLLVEHVRREGRAVYAISTDPQVRMTALEAGCTAADGDLSSDELATKIGVLLRDRHLRRTGRVCAGPLSVDLSSRQFFWDEEPVPAPPLLLDLAACLASRAGDFVAVQVLLHEVWGESWAQHDKVHKAVWRLRHQLRLPRGSGFILGKWGHGYGMFPDAAATSSPSTRRTISR
jgi:DNA-binding response OmpR family regulator